MNKPVISFESIKRQSDDFFIQLTAAIKSLRKDGTMSTSAIKKSHIAQVIKQYTGLNVIVYIRPGLNAAAYSPYLTPNHVFVRGSSTMSRILDVTKIEMAGTIDVENARVTGSFAEVGSEVVIGMDLFRPSLFTDDEIASIVLHEIGHIFTCWQFMSTMAYGALVINQTINNIFLTDNYQTKKLCIRAAEEVLGMEKEENIEDWVDTSKENIEIIFNTRFVRSLRTRSTTSYYDVRNCEQIADTFAAKHGAAVSFARATHKLNKLHGSYGKENAFAHILSQTASLVKVIRPFSGISLSDIIYTLDQPNRYDDPKDRIAFIKFQLIDDLKHIPAGNKQLRTDMLASIDDIDKLLKTINERKSIFNAIHETFTVFGKVMSNQRKDIKKLESMLYNDLFLQSAKLKNLH